MKTRPSSAFTLIETITAMAVILVLTGLVISISGYVTRKGGQSRANGEMAMLSAACDSYRADAGAYPRDYEDSAEDSNTDRLKPKEHFIPTDEYYEKSSRYLYKELTGDKKTGNAPDTDPDGVPEEDEPRYLKEFDPKILKVNKDENNKITEVKYIQDPFGYSYGYSTAALAVEEKFQSDLKKGLKPSRPSGDAVPGFNTAKFDLWSTGGSKPSAQPTQDAKKELEWAKWIKNW